MARVGFVGLLGSGNLGNDASLGVVLDHLRAERPDATYDAMCMGPEDISKRFGIKAVPIRWSRQYAERVGPMAAIALRGVGLGVDVVRTWAWVRRHDVVVVPGMGVLETSLPLRPTGTPYSMFLLSLCGRLTGTTVAFVSVGASLVTQPVTRWLIVSAARLASYRSYRDAASYEALRRQGLPTPDDPVYADLVFGVHTPHAGPGDPGTVCVGLMAFYGGTDDQQHGYELHRHYLGVMTSFVGWLLDQGHRVRLLWGDVVDDETVERLVADVRARRAELDPEMLAIQRLTTQAEVLDAIAPAGVVVGTRYHTVLSALKLCKPTISIGYAPKHDEPMTAMGMSDYSLSLRQLDLSELTRRFTTVQSRAAEVRSALSEANEVEAQKVEQQLRDVSSLLPPAAVPSSEESDGDPPTAVGDRAVASAVGTAGSGAAHRAVYKKDFWGVEQPKYAQPHFRLEKSARLINRLAGSRPCALLDVGCGPATLARLLNPNIAYHGIDIAVAQPAANLREVDLLQTPITFDQQRFDVVVAQGVFEYLSNAQGQKFAEIAKVLAEDGTFIVSYVNFAHRRPTLYWPYSNVQPFEAFRASLAQQFTIERVIPTSYNWAHSEPNRWWLRAVNMRLDTVIPVVAPKLAVEYFVVCRPKDAGTF